MSSMQFKQLWRTTTFKLTALYGLLFAAGTIALLGMVYLRSTVFLTKRVDGILNTEADALAHSPRPGLRQRLIEELTLTGDKTNLFSLFTSDGTRIAGNLDAIPPALQLDGKPIELSSSQGVPITSRILARRLPSGEILVVGRDADQLQEMRSLINSALLWSGVSIILVGLACGTALSVGPLRRLRRLQDAAQEIARGDLKRRMPTTQRHDELDMFAVTVNSMMNEVERLMSEVKGATEVIAHDLLAPLARATMQLRRIEREPPTDHREIGAVASQIEEVLERFRAILRIAELDTSHRRAGFARVDLADIVNAAADLYGPLAETAGIRLLPIAEHGVEIDGDSKLLFEAISNLIDNAIKYAGHGSTIQVRVGKNAAKPQLIVQDDGPGIPSEERAAVLQRFYRAERDRPIPGSGLGLSVVAAIVRLHGFDLLLEDADPGVRAVIECHPREVGF